MANKQQVAICQHFLLPMGQQMDKQTMDKQTKMLIHAPIYAANEHFQHMPQA